MEKNNFNFSFEDLRLFQKNIDFIDYIYKIAKTFPTSENENLTHRMKVAAQNIAINIAEGSGEHKSQYINSLRIAKAAIRECVVYMLIAKKQNFIDEVTEEEMRTKLVEISKMISGLIRSLKNPDQYKPRDVQAGTPPYYENNNNGINEEINNESNSDINFNYNTLKYNGNT
jgi:four helix bundle protein